MKPATRNLVLAFSVALIGVAIAAAGIYVGELDDAPGAGVGGIVLMLAAVVLAVKIARRKT
jgi:hypothetical protein